MTDDQKRAINEMRAFGRDARMEKAKSEKQHAFVDRVVSELDAVRSELGRLHKQMQDLDGETADIVGQMLVAAKELVGRIDNRYIESIARANVDRGDEA